jgi:predicted metal-binding membrane protein
MPEPLPAREKWLIVGVLMFLTGVAWVVTIYSSRLHLTMDKMELSTDVPHHGSQSASSEAVHREMMMPEMSMASAESPEASTALGLELGLFLAMWVAMMIAMMFPSVYPMVLLFARVSKGQAGTSANKAQVPTWIFVAGYLVIWTLIGGVMYLASLLVYWANGQINWFDDWAFVGSAGILIAAGLYQFSRWKRICLTHCRSPLSFILHQWREGRLGALWMGMDHGAYCVGCCWGLMLVMFVMGLMSLVWMGGLTIVVFLEKVTRYGPTLSKVVGGSLIILGVGILLHPSLMRLLSA